MVYNDCEHWSWTPPLPPPDECFNFSPLSCQDVIRVILSLPLNKAPGPDKVRGLSDQRLSTSSTGSPDRDHQLFSPHVQIPFRLEDSWSHTLLKEGDHEEPSNNRPLSLLNFASKVCEKKNALEQFSTYLISHNCLSSHQSGNKSLHSNETLNIYITDLLLEAMDKKKISVLILLDLSRAVDSISHQRLLQKLSTVGASPTTITWFQSYLPGRTRSVRIGSIRSDPLPITHGVPQGAILSPLLFCIYLNDLPCAPQFCRLESYVDDSKLLLSFNAVDSNDAKIMLEEALQRVPIWCCENQLLINPDKTKFMLIGTRQLINRHSSNFSVSSLGKSLTPVDSERDFCVIIDSHLTYDSHISYLVCSCLSTLVQINRVKNSFDKETLMPVISSMVFSKMFYCSTVWSNTSSTNIKKLLLIQNFACSIISDSRKYHHVTPLLYQLNWFSVSQKLQLRDTVMVYKCANNLAPVYLCNKLQKRTTIHDRATRHRNKLQIPFFRSAERAEQFHYWIPCVVT